MPAATFAGRVLVFPQIVSVGTTRTEDDRTVRSVPSSLVAIISTFVICESISIGTGMQISTVALRR